MHVTTPPYAPGTELIWQPPYHSSERVTVIRVAQRYASGRRAYAVRCHDGERIAHEGDLRPAA